MVKDTRAAKVQPGNGMWKRRLAGVTKGLAIQIAGVPEIQSALKVLKVVAIPCGQLHAVFQGHLQIFPANWGRELSRGGDRVAGQGECLFRGGLLSPDRFSAILGGIGLSLQTFAGGRVSTS